MLMGTIRMVCALVTAPGHVLAYLRRGRARSSVEAQLQHRPGIRVEARGTVGDMEAFWVGAAGRRKLAEVLVQTIRVRGPVLRQSREWWDGSCWIVFHFHQCQVRLHQPKAVWRDGDVIRWPIVKESRKGY